MKNKKLLSLLALICLFTVAVSTFIGCTRARPPKMNPQTQTKT